MRPSCSQSIPGRRVDPPTATASFKPGRRAPTDPAGRSHGAGKCDTSEFRDQVRRFKNKYRPTAILVEATGQGPALMSDIRAEQGLQIVPITPHEDKVSRLYKHLNAIRSGFVALPEGAPWAAECIDEVVQFPVRPVRRSSRCDELVSRLDRRAPAPRRTAPSRARRSGMNSRGVRLQPPRAETHHAMPRCGVCPQSSTLVTVDKLAVQNCVAVRKSWPRRRPSMCKSW